VQLASHSYNIYLALHKDIKELFIAYAGDVARMGEMRNVYKILVGKPEEKRQLKRPGLTWDDNIRISLREIQWEGVDWIHLAQGRVQW
jgi:hypothetical protein